MVHSSKRDIIISWVFMINSIIFFGLLSPNSNVWQEVTEREAAQLSETRRKERPFATFCTGLWHLAVISLKLWEIDVRGVHFIMRGMVTERRKRNFDLIIINYMCSEKKIYVIKIHQYFGFNVIISLLQTHLNFYY